MARRHKTVVPFRRRRRWTRAGDYGSKARPWWKQFSPIMFALPLAAFTAVLVWPSPAVPEASAGGTLALATEEELRERIWPTSADELDAAQPTVSGALVPVSSGQNVSAQFVLCGSGARVNCVVDGDTFWFQGAKIRIADINTPEVGEPQCAREAQLGAAATQRLLALLNAGPFVLGANPDGRDRDKYGRLLRTVSRGGQSLGAVLVREGLAEEWRGSRSSWC